MPNFETVPIHLHCIIHKTPPKAGFIALIVCGIRDR